MLIPVKFCKLLILFVFLLINVSQINAICQYHGHLLENEWRLILKYDNASLQLLRETTVQDGTVLYMVCNSNDIAEVTCENGQFNPQLPLNEWCGNHMMPQLKLENDRNLCGFNLYRVGYQIQCKHGDYFFETYKVCFDFERKRAVFTINEAYPFVIPRPYGMRFDPDEIFTMNIFSAYNKRNIYAQFRKTLGDGQNFMPDNAGDQRIDRGHLTPVADYMTYTLIATTFKMINVIPQFHTINDGNWKAMEEWARNPINTPAKVCSGAFSWVLQLPDTQGNLREMYLRGDMIPMPLWTYKIVLNCNGLRTVFLQYNNIHDKQMPPQIPHGICQEVGCPSNIYLAKSNYLGYTFCCDPEHFMANSVPNLRGYC
ncbi:uncharacterized protein LOC135958911 [Calliphora vicina]|uniref:uncharacterized protein LOC135958911 n=1 Tax=Calliphora vicina TaxID=7373 RepID=UPI00325B6FD3